MPENTFPDLCDTLETLSTAKGKQDKLQILKNYTNRSGRGLKFYDALRLFLPNWERERGPYRLAEHSFTKTLTNIFCLAPTGSDVSLLKNFNQSARGVAGKFKDYADAAYAVVRKKTGSKTTNAYTLREINEKLDAIASGSVRAQEGIIHDLFKTVSQLEIKWLIRLLLRDMKLGLGKGDIFLCYHPDASKYFNTNNSLRDLCADLEDLTRNATDIEIKLFSAFRPMLSLRCDVREFNRAVKDTNEYYVEEKFDGERFQLHFDGNKYKYFSRNGYDYTEEFSAHARAISGRLTARSVILDGEMMIYNRKTKQFGSKGMYVDIKKVKPDSNIQQCFCVFDLVYLDGVNVCNSPLKDRKALIEKVVRPLDGVLQKSRWKSVHSKQGVVDELNLSMDRKEEGIVFKHPGGKYLPNEKVGWWKVKLEYFEDVMSDLDVVILGGYYGQGATKGEISGYLVGVKEIVNQQETFLSFAKISTGLTREETKKLNSHLDPHWSDDANGVIHGKEKPDKWIAPERSKCLTIRGSELIKLYNSSSMKDYATSYTLRFPRILRARTDKAYNDCLTTEELTRLTEGSAVVEKLNKRHLELSDLAQTPAKRKKKELDFRPLPVDAVSDVLRGEVFVVLSGKGDWTKELVERAIRENGGVVALEVTENTRCMLVGDEHVRTKTYKGDVDIVDVEWLRRVLNEGEFEAYGTFDVVYMSEKTRRKFMQEFDCFGDGYYQEADQRSLRKVFEIYRKNNTLPMNPTVEEINEFESEIHLNASAEWKPLRGYTAYFDRYKIINVPTSTELGDSAHGDFAARAEFKLAGGVISPFLTEDCDCIIAARERFDEVEVYLQSLRRDIPIYSSPEDFKREILRGRRS